MTQEVIYELSMVTQNPSADEYGYFSTLEKALAFVEKKKADVSKYPNYYGVVEFKLREIDKLDLTGRALLTIDSEF